MARLAYVTSLSTARALIRLPLGMREAKELLLAKEMSQSSGQRAQAKDSPGSRVALNNGLTGELLMDRFFSSQNSVRDLLERLEPKWQYGHVVDGHGRELRRWTKLADMGPGPFHWKALAAAPPRLLLAVRPISYMLYMHQYDEGQEVAFFSAPSWEEVEYEIDSGGPLDVVLLDSSGDPLQRSEVYRYEQLAGVRYFVATDDGAALGAHNPHGIYLDPRAAEGLLDADVFRLLRCYNFGMEPWQAKAASLPQRLSQTLAASSDGSASSSLG